MRNKERKAYERQQAWLGFHTHSVANSFRASKLLNQGPRESNTQKSKVYVCKGVGYCRERRLIYLQRQTFESTVPLAEGLPVTWIISVITSLHPTIETESSVWVQTTCSWRKLYFFFMLGLRKADGCTSSDDSVSPPRSNQLSPTYYFLAGSHSFYSSCHHIVISHALVLLQSGWSGGFIMYDVADQLRRGSM